MADKELIAVAVSVVNHTPYCVTAHSASHRKYSKKPTLADQVSPHICLVCLWQAFSFPSLGSSYMKHL